MFDECLPEEERLGSVDPTGELRLALETLRKVEGLASVVRGRDGSASLPIASRLLETAARLEELLGRPKKVELDKIASLVIAESFPAGTFCFNKLPAFTAGAETRRREESIADHPLILPSPPECLSALTTAGGNPELGPALEPRARGGGHAL